MKLALASPTPTTTLAGTVRLALLLDRGTVNPPVGAAAVKETVHEVVVGVVRVVLVQLIPLNATGVGMVIVPLPPVAGIVVPATLDATTPVTDTGMLVVEGLAAIWKFAVATTPSGKVLVLSPNARHVLPEQLSDLPADVVEDPALTLTRLRSDEKLNDHCRPAGLVPPPARRTGRLTVPPATPEADPIVRETVCPSAIACRPKMLAKIRLRKLNVPHRAYRQYFLCDIASTYT